MIKVKVFVNNISAERFWDIEKPIPPIQAATNLNIVGINEKREGMLEVPFVFAINYTPAVAQISLKGKAHVAGSKDELRQVRNAYEQKKPPPPIILQSISNVVFLESVIVCRTLNIPPPIPLPKIPTVKEKKRAEPTYRA
ncbi:hypothetical protein DRO69_07390 [Candidatus Bathyarchaeota archaeon]|nr:MAG: hypothetical protein DRO69_07390 [Candidatus Bathyarchaeota archaeon]